MNKIDYSNIDVNSLKTFMTVLDVASVTKAAEILGVSQSAVSHSLDKLRLTFNDPLFVRHGRGILPTPRAQSLCDPIESILDSLKSLIQEGEFNPLVEPIEFTIATNDLPLGLIFPTLLKSLYAEGINPKFHFMPAGIPSANLLRASGCQMLITKTSIADPSFTVHYEIINSVIASYNKAVNDQINQYDITMEEAGKNIANIKTKHLKRIPAVIGHDELMNEVKALF